MSDTVAVITALTALCAVLLGPLVSLWSEGKRSRIAVLSANRQAWINELRSLVAEFMSLVLFLNATRNAAESTSERNAKIERLMLIEAKVGLMINPKEDDHSALVTEIRRQIEATIKPMSDTTVSTVKQSGGQLHKIAQGILKREWERVKKTE